MTKIEAGTVFLSAVAAIAAGIAAVQARTTFRDLSDLAGRVTKLETQVPAAQAPAAGPSNADLARDLSALRVQVAALQSRPREATPGPASPQGATQVGGDPRVTAQHDEEQQRAWLEGMTNRVVESLTEQLGLTAQQESQVRDVVTRQLVEFREARLQNKGGDARKAMDDFNADTDAKIRGLLTPEQQQKFDEIAAKPGGIFVLPSVAAPAAGGARKVTPGR